MKAIRIHQTGDLSVIQCDNVSAPKEIGPDDVLIKPEIAGVNCIDTYFRSGHFHVQLPFTLGQECGGKVARVGESVKDIQPGDYVVALVGSSFAERVVAPRSKVTKLPKELDTRTAVAAWLQGLTAVTLTHAAYQIKRGDYVLVHAAAGGTGLMLVQVAKALGAHVIGTTSTTEKAERAKTLGADHVLLYKDDIVGRVNEVTSGKGVNVVYDSVGKSTLDQSLEVLAQHGSLILFGESSGAPDPLPVHLLRPKNIKFMCFALYGYLNTQEEYEHFSGILLDLLVSDKVHANVWREYLLSAEGVQQAQQELMSRTTTGKLLIRIPPSPDEA